MRPDYHLQALEWADKYGGIARFSLGGQHIILVTDPHIAATVLGRGPGSLARKTIAYGYFDLATNHLGLRSFFTTCDEEQWARVRKGTAAAFSQQNIR
jgi:cytochrome P450